MARSDYTKRTPRKYKKLEEEAARMTINRQVNYGYRGTTPNYVLDFPTTPVPKN